MSAHHHNTTDESGQTLMQFEQIASTQESTILRFFMINRQPFSPSQVWKEALPKVPLTSVRRAISNLERDGHLTKTKHKRSGLYGRPECLWEIS